jgi:hypothetical protein
LQQFIDAYNHENWGIFTSNIPKLVLALESVCFDLLFIFQHFYMYKGQQPKIFNASEQIDGEGEEHDQLIKDAPAYKTFEALPSAESA